MSLRRLVDLAQSPPELPFLLIGGHAVAAHGHARMTFDVDFLARASDREAWMGRAAAGGLGCVAQSDNFAQFAAGEDGEAFDLMFVSDDTFAGMQAAAVSADLGPVRVPVPSLRHLIALKLHALRHAPEVRMSKDASDIEMLLRRNGVSLADPAWRELFLRHGTADLLAAFERILRHE